MNGDPPAGPARFERRLDGIARLVGKLIECSDPRECERHLLDAVFLLESARAGAVWRRGRERWSCVLERGPQDSLPLPELVDSVLEGDFSRDVLPAGHVVLQAGSGPGGIALSLGDARSSEETRDVLEALLHVARTLGGIGIPLRDPEFPARPRGDTDDTHDPR